MQASVVLLGHFQLFWRRMWWKLKPDTALQIKCGVWSPQKKPPWSGALSKKNKRSVKRSTPTLSIGPSSWDWAGSPLPQGSWWMMKIKAVGDYWQTPSWLLWVQEELNYCWGSCGKLHSCLACGVCSLSKLSFGWKIKYRVCREYSNPGKLEPKPSEIIRGYASCSSQHHHPKKN